jgi:hypothetical protein
MNTYPNHSILANDPFVYAYNQLIVDDQGKPFVEVNAACARSWQ